MNSFLYKLPKPALLKHVSFNVQSRGFCGIYHNQIHSFKSNKLLGSNLLKPIVKTQSRSESSNLPDLPDTKSGPNVINTESSSNPFGFINDSPFARFFENSLIDLHDFGSIEWSTTIVCAAVVFRIFICFPIKIYQDKLSAKLINIQPKIDEVLKKDLPSNFSALNREAQKHFMRKVRMFFYHCHAIKIFKVRELFFKLVVVRNHFYKIHGCAPQKIPMASCLQLPFWIYLTSSIRNLTSGKYGTIFLINFKKIYRIELLIIMQQ